MSSIMQETTVVMENMYGIEEILEPSKKRFYIR